MKIRKETLKIVGGIVLGLVLFIGAVWFFYDPLYSGVVVTKDHRAAYTTTSMMKVGDTYIPQTHHHPERWQITVNGITPRKGKSVTRTINVELEVWRNIEEGDFWKHD